MERINPAAAGFDPALLECVKPTMQGYIDTGRIAGLSTLVARQGRVVQLECFGSADLERKRPMREDTIHRIYSMSKPVTVAAALTLCERGLFRINDPIDEYIPSFKDMTVVDESGGDPKPASGPVTIRHLLTHTSGLSYTAEGTAAAGFYKEIGEAMDENTTTAEAVDAIAGAPLLFQPGEHWHYGFSIDVIGRLVEVISGKRLGQYLRDEIFAPLGMDDSGFFVTVGQATRLAALYGPKDDKRKDLDDNLSLLEDPEKSRWLGPRAMEEGGGGLVSTITDYARFAQMLANGGTLDGTRILGRKTINLMSTDHLLDQHKKDYDWPDHRGYSFGLGVRVMEDLAPAGSNGSIGEYGWAGLAGTWVWIDPAEELIALFMPQLIPDMYYPAARQFSTIVYSALG